MKPKEHKKLAKHVAAIEEFERLRTAEEERLKEEIGYPKEEEMIEISADNAVRSREAVQRAETEAIDRFKKSKAGLARFDEEHKPNLIPWDTPSKIRADIESRTHLMSSKTDDQVAANKLMRAMFAKTRPIGPSEAELYPQYRARVLALAEIAPSINDDPLVAEASSPSIGLQNLQQWCLASQRKPESFWQSTWFKIAMGAVGGAIFQQIVVPAFAPTASAALSNWANNLVHRHHAEATSQPSK